MDLLEKLYLEQIEDYCNVKFEENNLPAGVNLAIADLIENDPSEYRKTSEKLSDLSITYEATGTLPTYILNWLEPYRRPFLVGNKKKKHYER